MNTDQRSPGTDRAAEPGGSGRALRPMGIRQAFREIRAFRIYDGPTEVHKWSLAKKIKRDWKAEQH